MSSMVDDDLLKNYSRVGLIPARDLNNWRALINKPVPAPIEDERALHTPFIEQGLSLPLHDFLRGLLFFYGLRLHHLSPSGASYTSRFSSRCANASWGPAPLRALEADLLLEGANDQGRRPIVHLRGSRHPSEDQG